MDLEYFYNTVKVVFISKKKEILFSSRKLTHLLIILYHIISR